MYDNFEKDKKQFRQDMELPFDGPSLWLIVCIQEDCNRLSKDFLISKELLDRVENLGSVKASFVDETVPRGNEAKMKLYSLEKA